MISRNGCRISENGRSLAYADEDDDQLEVLCLSNNGLAVMTRSGAMTDNTVVLRPEAAKELRDFLNRRYPT